MATKKISDLQLRTDFDASCNLPVDDSSQTWRVTGTQLKDFVKSEVAPLTTLGDVLYAGASGTPTRLAGNTTTTEKMLTQTGTGSASAAPTWRDIKAPTVQKFTSTGTTTGYVFTISTSSTVAVGDTYTNNGNTYTVLAALSAQTGQVLFCSGASAPTASGTLTRATGAGTASITFTAADALATYTRPSGPAPLFLKVKLRASGGSGGGGSTASNGAAGTAGKSSFFGANLLIATGGSGGAAGNTGGSQPAGGSGGSFTVNSPAIDAGSINGQSGENGWNMLLNQYVPGGGGGGQGGGRSIFGTGSSAVANTGGGGQGGGNIAGTASQSGAGGGEGGLVEAIIPNPGSTYVYLVGASVTGGAGAGSGSQNGGASGSGILIVEEHYQ